MNPLSLIAAALFCQSAVAQNLPPADDFPNSPPGSPLVIGPAGAVTVTGILNSAEDLDVFSFDVGSNTVGTATTLTVYTTGDVDTNGVLRRVGDATNPIIASDEGGTGNFRIVKAVEPGKFSIQVGGKLSFNGAVNSYTLHVELTPGNPPGVPDIDVPEVPRGSTVAFGSITVNTSATRTITLRNTGTANLQVTGITIPGSANTPAGTVLPFRIEEGAARVIAPGATSNFRVIFKPLTAASFTGTVNVASNDPDENPWTFIVTGSGKPVEPPASPEIGVGLGGADLPSGGTVNFGVVPVPATAPVVKELVISNSGQGVLQLGAVTLSPVPTAGANGEELLPQPQPPAGFFRVLTQPASSIDPGRTTVLRLGAGGGDANAAAVVAPGRYMMLATIPNSDSDENPYRLLLTAEVQAPPNPGAPEIAVFAGDASLEDDGTLDLGSTHTGAPI
ncbi:MAG TPA: choice-of-anchor D domain-containing protein, partial [Verrucomicrobiales bacterium]|nr:choice-of-anchor D domain-containing protein [Verrucomicrobiales bacterium]